MNKIYQLIDRITPKNYWLQLLTIILYSLVILSCFNLIISDVLHLKFDLPNSKLFTFLKKYWILQFAVIVIIGPLIETTFFQWLPYKFYNYFKKSSKFDVLFWVFSALIFGLSHTYSFGYQIAATILGLNFVFFTMYYAEKEKNYFWPIFLIHCINNLLAILDF
jgi:uncharacterized protein